MYKSEITSMSIGEQTQVIIDYFNYDAVLEAVKILSQHGDIDLTKLKV